MDVFLTPLPLAAVVLLAVNDHMLKGASLLPAVVTGKLSDFAGLFFFPLFLAALVGLIIRPAPGKVRYVELGCAVATMAVFAAINTSVLASDTYGVVLGALRGAPRVMNVRDPSDLVALPMCTLALVHANRVRRSVGLRIRETAGGVA